RGYDDGRVSHLAVAHGDAPIAYCIGCESGKFADYQPSSPYLDRESKRHVFAWNSATKVWEDLVTGEHTKDRLVVPQPGCYEPSYDSDKTFACSWLLRPEGGGIAYFGQS